MLFPDIHDAIDFSKKIEFLDTGMRPIAPFSDIGDRIADVLAKVHLKSGNYRYIAIFIHIEIEGKQQTHLMERMYIYNYRYFDKRLETNIPVISAAILTDDNEKYRPDEYKVSFCGFELRMKIPIVKIIDFKLKKELREKLETSANPAALVVKAQLKSMEVNNANDNTKFETAKELLRECYKQGYSRKKLYPLVKFIEWVIRLSKALEKRLKEEVLKIEEEFNMPYLASWERSARKEGKQEGRQEGSQEEKVEIARRMLFDNFSIEQIIKYTGLTEKEIKALMH